MNSGNSQACSYRTSSPVIQEPQELTQSSLFEPGFAPLTSFFPPPLDLNPIIPYNTFSDKGTLWSHQTQLRQLSKIMAGL